MCMTALFVGIMALPFTGCVTPGKCLNMSELQVLQLLFGKVIAPSQGC